MIFSAIKKDDEVRLFDPARYKEYVNRIKEGQLLTIEIKRKRDKISTEQRGYLHLSLRWLGWELGMTEDETKLAMKDLFFYEIDDRTGLKKHLSTEEASQEDIAKFVQSIDEWCISFLGYGLPPPVKIKDALRRQR